MIQAQSSLVNPLAPFIRFGWRPRGSAPVVAQFVDPRFITAARPRSLVSTPLQRSLVTTPRVMGVHLPQGPDFSTMDIGEQPNNTFDFGPWLPAGVTIASVTSVTITAYSGIDPCVSKVGSNSIVSSPSTGAASAAVLQQFKGLAVGIASLAALIVTSDGQTLNLWANQQVQTAD